MNAPMAQGASVSTDMRDDRVLMFTRVVAVGVVAILLLAVLALYLFPDFTDQNFAWTIKPRMMAMAIGAGYLMGAYYFARVLTVRRWHHVAAGFLAITAFTIGMAAATIVHWDRFHPGDWHFYLWAVTYAITPLLVPFIWWRNQRYDPGVPEANDLEVPRILRMVAGLAGVGGLIAGVLIFVQPQLAKSIWPWSLTDLTARILAGWLMLPAIGGLYLSRESRWSAWRVLFETVTVGALFFMIALFFSWSDLSQTNLLTWVVLLGLVGTIVALPVAIMFFERRRHSMGTSTSG